MRTAFLAATCAAGLLAGCGNWKMPTRLAGDLPTTAVVPAAGLKLTPSLVVPLEKLVFWGAYAGAAYLILDPLAPNWEIEEAKFSDGYYRLSLHMRRYYAGGAGEAREVFHRRAKQIVSAGGYDSYQVVEYTEGLESSVLGSQRVAAGVIRLAGQDG